MKNKKKTDFSVLMSVYHKENPVYLENSLESILNQTVMPKEITLVKDGKLTQGLAKVIKHFIDLHTEIFNIITLRENVGLGRALKIGVENCSNNLIARMDSDDISLPNRFQKQLEYLNKHKNIDVVGAWIGEFEKDPNRFKYIRRVPASCNEIQSFALIRNPMNHMTVMFKKDSVQRAGNYKPFLLFEDYYLWVRMLMEGFKFANIQEVLVLARINKESMYRRGDLSYLKRELKLQLKLKKIGFITQERFVKNCIYRGFLRLSPLNLRYFIYKKLLRKGL